MLATCLILPMTSLGATAQAAPAKTANPKTSTTKTGITKIATVDTPTKMDHLTSTIRASVKSILNEHTSEGTRIGAVVRLYNEGNLVTRIPDYEVRVQTKDGMIYSLRASTTNAKTISPKERVELSYMVLLDRSDSFSLTNLIWVNVDLYVYPKQEKIIASMPISSLQWKGSNATITEPAAIKQWGQPFTIPQFSSTLQYTTVSTMVQNIPQGPATVIGLLVENLSDSKQSIPDFRIEGKSADDRIFNGKRLEQGLINLQPREQQYIHYAIPSENSKLASLNILTPEKFSIDNQNSIEYVVGHLNIVLPSGGNLGSNGQLYTYKWGNPIQFDWLNKLIGPEIKVSLDALRMYGAEEDGFKTIVAKFKMQNVADEPVSVPKFQAELLSVNGSYLGTRQAATVDTLFPSVSYAIYYAFVVPNSEKGDQLSINILDSETLAPYHIPIASFRTQTQQETADTVLDFYPYNLTINQWSVDKKRSLNNSDTSIEYKMNLVLQIGLQDKVAVEQSFTHVRLEITNQTGNIMSSQLLSFTGENRLISGQRTISFNSDRDESQLVLRIYETVDTPFGESRRLVKELQQ